MMHAYIWHQAALFWIGVNALCNEQIEVCVMFDNYRKISSIRRALVGNKLVDHSDVIGASPVGTAPTTSLFST